MKNACRARAVGVILAAFVVAGCSSTQPDRVETRTASLSFATTASVPVWDCYESPFPFCFPALDGNPPAQKIVDRQVPWRYSVAITIVRAGTYTEEVAFSTTGTLGTSVGEPGDVVPDFVSLTNYDPDQPPVADRDVGGIHFTNGKTVSSGSPVYLSQVGIDPGIPNMLDTVAPVPGAPATFDFELNTGDTVIVRARKESVAASPAVSPAYENVRLKATLALAGSPVVGQGPQTSPTDDKAGFTFSFRVQ
jgi:hypothetical protein